ncbi:rhomboid family GlyGly-CTERM serine protease [Thiothrix caldifontis]|uniref:Rhomboid family GlyGly-CTERM serine protease n=1 Tax=Thiothrix caldifontis TaxID=525918 RepID=A0A1H3VF46_9GAMM|nr:rhombosortase [Thiothrix caldifontis]SDZ73281.1 rhomboid family GlyGly-CTERM serine protease [Thiothrix caldifontis]
MLHTLDISKPTRQCVNTCIIAIIFTVLLPLLQFFHDELLYHRHWIVAGEYWRIWSGSLVHTNFWHLVLNLAGLWLLAFIAPLPFSKSIQLIQIAFLTSCVGAGLWWLSPEWVWYAGFSGTLYGLFMLGGIHLLQQRDWLMAALILLGLGGKTVWDWWSGGESASASLIEAPVIYAAHLYGMAGSLLLSIPTLLSNLSKR